MKLNDIKIKIIEWQDFYGGDICDVKSIQRAKTKDELSDVLNSHKRYMENMLCDAISHLESFKKELDLF